MGILNSLESLIVNDGMEILARHNTYDSKEALEDAVDARHLSELSLPNSGFIDGEFFRSAQKSIDEMSIESLMST